MKKVLITISASIVCIAIIYGIFTCQTFRLRNQISMLEDVILSNAKGPTGDILYTMLFLGIDEKGTNIVRGRNDITMLIIEKIDKIEVWSFPRDTLVRIPGRGYWLINSLYPYMNAYGAVRWMEKTYNIEIDNVFAIDVHQVRKLMYKIAMMKLPKSIANIVTNYDYDEDWIRHMSQLQWEARRQLRIQTYLKRAVKKAKAMYKLYTLRTSLFGELINYASCTDIVHISRMQRLYNSFMEKPIEWCLWPGIYEKRDFWKMFKGKWHTWVWVPTAYSYTEMYSRKSTLITNGHNPYEYSRTEFIKTNSNNYEIPINWSQSHFIMYSNGNMVNINSWYKLDKATGRYKRNRRR